MTDISELKDTVDHLADSVVQVEKFSGRELLQFPGDIPTYIEIFIGLEDRISIKQVRTIYDLFKKLSEYEVGHGNTIFAGTIYEAILLQPRSAFDRGCKELREDRRQEIEDYIANRKREADREYTREFLETLSVMVKMHGYLNFKEIFIINSMFNCMDRFQEYIYISDTEENTYAIKRCQNGEYEGKVEPKKIIVG